MVMPNTPQQLAAQIPAELNGQRLDLALARLFPDYSRSRLQQWIEAGHVIVEGRPRRRRDKVSTGQQVQVTVSLEADKAWQAEAIPLEIVYEDPSLLVINKPAGLVVHPGAGNRSGTLLNALLHYAPELASLPRAGIVHRLDKDTSGLLVIARDLKAQKSLVEQLQARTVSREYLAVVNGVILAGGKIEAPIGRHPVTRTRMAVVARGKPAVSHYRVVERFRAHTLLRVELETGRTHQIRVHLAHARHPLVGDPEYAGRQYYPAGATPALLTCLQAFRRQALHAERLRFIHPQRQESMCFESALALDMQNLLAALHKDCRHGTGQS